MRTRPSKFDADKHQKREAIVDASTTKTNQRTTNQRTTNQIDIIMSNENRMNNKHYHKKYNKAMKNIRGRKSTMYHRHNHNLILIQLLLLFLLQQPTHDNNEMTTTTVSAFAVTGVMTNHGRHRQQSLLSVASKSSYNMIGSELAPNMTTAKGGSTRSQKTTTTRTTTTSPTANSKYSTSTTTIRSVQMLDMLKRAPAIGGSVLLDGWTDQVTTDYMNALQILLETYPILTGSCTLKNYNSLTIHGGTFNNSFDRFCTVYDRRTVESAIDYKQLSSTPTGLLNTIKNTSWYNDILIDDPTNQCNTTSDTIKQKLPLFHTTLILLPKNYAVLSIQMSHIVGDGTTFYHILKQISILMSSIQQQQQEHRQREGIKQEQHPTKLLERMVWKSKHTQEIYPPTFSKNDVWIAYGPPFWMGVIKNIVSGVIKQQQQQQKNRTNNNKNRNSHFEIYAMHILYWLTNTK